MKTSSKRRVAAAAVVILLALFLWRPGASRLKSRIISSISAGVGRPVDVGAVHIRLLPRPGFELENLVVYDDAEFGAEPMLRASEVEASLRLMSLIRGRLEVARLDLTEPSLNLVHSEGGRWNLETLLERTARIPLAPTSKARREARPGFPYIEATSGRINIKSGAEKKPYALTNADFSLWQDSENTWGVRLKGQPVRTDLNLNDIGLLELSGSWQRAETFHDTPMQFDISWKRAQLGQVTKLITGSDKGWRGEIQLAVALAGTPAALRVSSNAAIDDFRRYDISTGRPLHLGAGCDAEYSSLSHEFHQVICSAPVGQGLIAVTGDMGLPGSHQLSLTARAENVPANAAAALVQRAKKNIPEDLETEGVVNGTFSMQQDAAAGARFRFDGTGELADFRLSSAINKAEIKLETIPFSLVGDTANPFVRKDRGMAAGHARGQSHIEIGPFTLSRARTGSPAIRGRIDRGGYNFSVAGETDIAKALHFSRMIGVPTLATNAEGTAQVDLQIAGAWVGPGDGAAAGFFGPQVTGTAKLKGVQVSVRAIGSPVEIVSADMQLSADKVRISKLTAKAAGTNWTGSVDMPRGCGADCAVHFALNANQIALGSISEWAGPSPKKQPWYRVLESSKKSGSSFLGSLRASGHVSADRVETRGVIATHVSANVSMEAGKLQIADLSADFMGGRYHGEWRADFGAKQPVCKGSGTFAGVSLAGFGDAMNDDWIAGSANASYEVSGRCPAEFWQSAEGTMQVEMKDGAFPHIAVNDGAGPFRVALLSGEADLHAGKIEIKKGLLDSPDGQYDVSGTALLTREVDIILRRNPSGTTAGGYAITGTLAEPQVAPLTSAEQARLKSLPPQ